jgi:hypothetical protein
MIKTATIRVRSGDERGSRPERSLLERAAELLQESGFRVLRVGRFGVNVQADELAFQRELGVDLRGTGHVVEAPHPRQKELSQLIDLVEVAKEPLPFAS